MSDSILLQCDQLCKRYQEGSVQTNVLRDVSFTMRPGEMMAIVGSSGSGKSTLLHLLGGSDAPTSGDVLFNGRALSSMSSAQKAELRNRELGFIYQFHHLLPDFTALENVAMPLLIGKKQAGGAGAGDGDAERRRPGETRRAPSLRAFRRRTSARGDRARAGQQSSSGDGGRADR